MSHLRTHHFLILTPHKALPTIRQDLLQFLDETPSGTMITSLLTLETHLQRTIAVDMKPLRDPTRQSLRLSAMAENDSVATSHQTWFSLQHIERKITNLWLFNIPLILREISLCAYL